MGESRGLVEVSGLFMRRFLGPQVPPWKTQAKPPLHSPLALARHGHCIWLGVALHTRRKSRRAYGELWSPDARHSSGAHSRNKTQ